MFYLKLLGFSYVIIYHVSYPILFEYECGLLNLHSDLFGVYVVLCVPSLGAMLPRGIINCNYCYCKWTEFQYYHSLPQGFS